MYILLLKLKTKYAIKYNTIFRFNKKVKNNNILIKHTKILSGAKFLKSKHTRVTRIGPRSMN